MQLTEHDCVHFVAISIVYEWHWKQAQVKKTQNLYRSAAQPVYNNRYG
ncbi:hypothetical protein HanPSC8_Chr03g0121671 [Helianthus annuus]|nr:hypothetical protein HanPSC8_Chr03g0121671 [Helianthus annuus]